MISPASVADGDRQASQLAAIGRRISRVQPRHHGSRQKRQGRAASSVGAPSAPALRTVALRHARLMPLCCSGSIYLACLKNLGQRARLLFFAAALDVVTQAFRQLLDAVHPATNHSVKRLHSVIYIVFSANKENLKRVILFLGNVLAKKETLFDCPFEQRRLLPLIITRNS